jgi:tetratricopeptide (TPR) repeat protein
MVQDMLSPEPSQEDTMLEQAIESIRQGKFAQSKDLLTRLLRTDQNNATYWVWMSATMETQKERLYCLQMAYKMDPTNAAARRGLIMMGALNPGESLTPFPMNHPRPWEAKIKLADEKPKQTGLKRVTSNPVFRLAVIMLIGAAVIGGGTLGLSRLFLNRPAQQSGPVGTPRPTVTSYTNNNASVVKPTIHPLATFLQGGTYTPTPIYAATPHGDVALDSYRGAMRAYNQGQWDTVASMMEQVATIQPGSVDAVYFMAEAKRLSGQYRDALDYYQIAVDVNGNFAPIYLGRARATLALNPKNDVIADLNRAITLDENFTEAYIERAHYYIRKNDFNSAKADMGYAITLNPTSPLIQLDMARLLLAAGENEAALSAAQKAKELDITMLEAYLVLGMAYRATGQIDQAVDVLEVYTTYSPNNAEAFMVLGAAYFNRGDYETALKDINQAIQIDSTSSESYYWRGEIHLARGENDQAVNDFRQSFRYNATSFDAAIGIGRALIATQDYRNAYAEIIKIEKLADTDKKRAIFLYYRAIALENINEPLAAYNDWRALLLLPENAVSAEMRAEAETRLVAIKTATPPAPSATATATLIPTGTRFPSKTPSRTLTPKASPTP